MITQRSSNTVFLRTDIHQPPTALLSALRCSSAARTSVRGITFLPQIAARAGDSVFGAKMPLPAFFMAAAFFAPAAFFSLLTWCGRGSARLQREPQIFTRFHKNGRSLRQIRTPSIFCDTKLQQK